jgi:hypothetical protein
VAPSARTELGKAVWRVSDALVLEVEVSGALIAVVFVAVGSSDGHAHEGVGRHGRTVQDSPNEELVVVPE